MREWTDDDGVTEIGPHPARLFQDFLDPVPDADGLQLMVQIGNHSASHLMVEMKLVVLQGHADGLVILFGDKR